MLRINGCVTPNSVPHLSQWLWRFTGETLQRAHKKSLNSVIDSTVPETVVPRVIIHALVLFACRSKRLSVHLILITKPLSLDFYTTSRAFFPSRCSSCKFRKWSALDNAPPPVTACTSYALPYSYHFYIHQNHSIFKSSKNIVTTMKISKFLPNLSKLHRLNHQYFRFYVYQRKQNTFHYIKLLILSSCYPSENFYLNIPM